MAKRWFQSDVERVNEEIRKEEEEHQRRLKGLEEQRKRQMQQAYFGGMRATNEKSTPQKEPYYQSALENPGLCIMVCNDGHQREYADQIAMKFLTLGHQVMYQQNISAKGMLKFVQDAINQASVGKGLFASFFFCKGSRSFGIESGGNELEKIVKMLSPDRARALADRPKLVFFQCDARRGMRESARTDDTSKYSPPYSHAFVTYSSHQDFPRIFWDSLSINDKRSLDAIMNEVTEDIMPFTEEKRSLLVESTLKKQIYLRSDGKYK